MSSALKTQFDPSWNEADQLISILRRAGDYHTARTGLRSLFYSVPEILSLLAFRFFEYIKDT
jgi:hypothetical protein